MKYLYCLFVAAATAVVACSSKVEEPETVHEFVSIECTIVMPLHIRACPLHELNRDGVQGILPIRRFHTPQTQVGFVCEIDVIPSLDIIVDELRGQDTPIVIYADQASLYRHIGKASEIAWTRLFVCSLNFRIGRVDQIIE